MKLIDVPIRVPIRLTDVPIPGKNQLRMQEMGVRVGAHAVVLQHAGFGGVVLNIAGARVAIDHNSAKKLQAEVIS